MSVDWYELHAGTVDTRSSVVDDTDPVRGENPTSSDVDSKTGVQIGTTSDTTTLYYVDIGT